MLGCVLLFQLQYLFRMGRTVRRSLRIDGWLVGLPFSSAAGHTTSTAIPSKFYHKHKRGCPVRRMSACATSCARSRHAASLVALNCDSRGALRRLCGAVWVSNDAWTAGVVCANCARWIPSSFLPPHASLPPLTTMTCPVPSFLSPTASAACKTSLPAPVHLRHF
jgi:hypothetical protein